MNVQIGAIIKIARQNKNMTQEELAEKLNITSQAVSKWERNLSAPDIGILAKLCKTLEISADFLIGTKESSNNTEPSPDKNPLVFHELQNCWPTLELWFGLNLVSVFSDTSLKEKIRQMRINLAKEGILLPLIHIKDCSQLRPDEFVVLSYESVLFYETVESPEVRSLGYILEAFETTIRNKYAHIISPDITKLLVDNLRMECPALIEGIIPDKISYHVLTDILKEFIKRGNAPKYLNKVIEISEKQLRMNSEASITEIVDKIMAEISDNNLWIFLADRG